MQAEDRSLLDYGEKKGIEMSGVCVSACSVALVVSDSFATPGTVAPQAPLSMGFPTVVLQSIGLQRVGHN